MTLSRAITALRDQVLADLAAAHDYYTDTKIAWRMVHDDIKAGHTITIRNMTTGTVTTQAELVAKARGYVTGQLAEATFQQFVSIFENFYLDLLVLWLTAHPESLGKRTVDLRTILELPDKDAVTRLVVRKELDDVLHGPPSRWFEYLEGRVKLGCPAADEIGRFAEAKASRDVLVHNKGIANKTYGSKAGDRARFQEGDRINIPEHYHRETWELIRKIVSDVADAAGAKAS